MNSNQRPSGDRVPERTSSETLTESVGRLADEVYILRDVLAEIREEMTWVTQNGLPHQPIEHVLLKSMAKDPFDPKWGEKLVVERYPRVESSPNSTVDPESLDRVVHDLQLTIEDVAQEQLDIVLTAIASIRAELIVLGRLALQVEGGQVETRDQAERLTGQAGEFQIAHLLDEPRHVVRVTCGADAPNQGANHCNVLR